jgi:hypothetical protein
VVKNRLLQTVGRAGFGSPVGDEFISSMEYARDSHYTLATGMRRLI